MTVPQMKQRPSIQEQGTNVTFAVLPLNFLSIMAFSSETHEACKANHVGLTLQGLRECPHRWVPHWDRQQLGVNPSVLTSGVCTCIKGLQRPYISPETSKELCRNLAEEESGARCQHVGRTNPPGLTRSRQPWTCGVPVKVHREISNSSCF